MVQVPIVTPASPIQDLRLLEAARGGRVGQVKELIKEGVSIDATDAGGITPLIFAAMSGHFDIVKILVESGADTSIADDLGYNAYRAAMFFGDFRGATMPPHDKILQYLSQFEVER